jgi:hypothetical protein
VIVPTFDILCIVGGICALLMVAGALYLLYKGTITLSEKTAEEAVRVEFKKLINITTRYPALGLFVIGWAFLGLVLYLSRTNSQPPLEIQAKLVSDDAQSATVIGSAVMLQTTPGSDGGIDALLYPTRVDAIRIDIITPGYAQGKISKIIIPQNIHNNVVDLGILNPGTKATDKPSVKPENIVQVPDGKLPPLTQGGKLQ